jgi:hypothetical protein
LESSKNGQNDMDAKLLINLVKKKIIWANLQPPRIALNHISFDSFRRAVHESTEKLRNSKYKKFVASILGYIYIKYIEERKMANAIALNRPNF